MTEAARSESRVVLPNAVRGPYEVYVNGVRQERGRDYEVEGHTLVFRRELRQEGRLGFWRWASIVFGVAGTYRQNDVVDVAYEVGGRRAVASGLPLEEPAEPG
ncbi:MAG TPA: hypothetical protein VNT23_05850 [Gaiellaceae bacterium]|nr:hypothetical protein [Gaiellaceae bacterium]